MTEAYTSYGYSGFEAEIDSIVQKRVIFAISRASNPKALSWYVFVEGLEGYQTPKFDMVDKVGKIPLDQGWDHINLFGSMLPGGGAGQFNLQNYIDVNQFAGYSKKHGISVGKGALYIWSKGGTVNANIRIALANSASSAIELADFVVQLKPESPLLNDFDLRRAGRIWLLGSTPFTPSAVSNGPVSSAKAGNFSAYDRTM